MKNKGKYKVSKNEDELDILPNLLEITDKKLINIQEAKGFSEATIRLVQDLSDETVFDKDYILKIHKLALRHLYSFAGKYRTVNVSKGGFSFPPARFLEASMEEFQNTILDEVKVNNPSESELIEYIAFVHAELLFIHPFREGNGRTARLLANLMAYKFGYNSLAFDKLDSEEMFENYIVAIQQGGLKNYVPMIEIIKILFQS